MVIYTWQQLAQSSITNPLLNSSVQNLSGAQFFSKLLPALITFGLVIGTVVFVFMLIMGGLQWITAGGDKVSLENARGKVLNAIIGVGVLLSIYAVTNLVQCFFRVNLLQFTVGTLNIGAGPPPFCKSVGGGGWGGGTTNANCPCGGGGLGRCASTGQVGQITFGGLCYRCTASGWMATGTTGCSVISCGACP